MYSNQENQKSRVFRPINLIHQGSNDGISEHHTQWSSLDESVQSNVVKWEAFGVDTCKILGLGVNRTFYGGNKVSESLAKPSNSYESLSNLSLNAEKNLHKKVEDVPLLNCPSTMNLYNTLNRSQIRLSLDSPQPVDGNLLIPNGAIATGGNCNRTLLFDEAYPRNSEPNREPPSSRNDELRKKLLALSEKVAKDQEEKRCDEARTDKKKNSGRYSSKPKASKKSDMGEKTEEKARDEETTENDSPRSKRKRGRAVTNPVGSKNPSPSSSKATVLNPFNASSSASKKPSQVVSIPQKTLFSMDKSASASHSLVNIPFRVLEETSEIFDDIKRVLDSPERIQAPPLYLGYITTGQNASNFTISSEGKIHFLRGVDPSKSHLMIRYFVCRWKSEVFVIPSSIGFPFLLHVLRDLPGVEIITFHSVSILLPLLAFAKGDLFTHCISDVRIMSWILNPSERDENIFDFSCLLKNQGVMPQSEYEFLLPGNESSDQITFESKPKDNISLQAVCNAVFYLEPLYRRLYGQLGAKGLLQAYIKQEKRMSLPLARMKYNGFIVQMSEVNKFREACIVEMESLKRKAHALIGDQMVEFNIQSSEHCREALFDKFELGKYLTEEESASIGHCSLTKGGKASTAEEILRVLAPHHPLPNIIIRYRRAAKLLQNYAEGMMGSALPCSILQANNYECPTANHERSLQNGTLPLETSDAHLSDAFTDEILSIATHTIKEVASDAPFVKLYPNFIQEGTDTGRLSCVEPNLQNLPRTVYTVSSTPSIMQSSSEEEVDLSNDSDAFHFRNCFVAPEGYVLLSIDYEQIELRVLAHLCMDPTLVENLTSAKDVHQRIAMSLFNKQNVTAEERNLAKRVVFGVIYGASPRTLASQMCVSPQRMLQITSLLKSTYPQIDIYKRKIVEQCREEGYVRTISGRLRMIPEINSTIAAKRNSAERQAFNTIVQGSAADIMKAAMLAIENQVLSRFRENVLLLMQVHDELVLAVKRDVALEVIPIAARIMTSSIPLLVPLRVKAKVGSSLGSLTEWSVDHELGIAIF